MAADPPGPDVTRLLQALRLDPPREAVEQELYAALYAQLHELAWVLMLRERPQHTLEPRALVHEAYFKLVNQADMDWRDRAHFLGVATRAMRQVLVDHARRRSADKRGAGWERITITNLPAPIVDPTLEIIEIEDILVRLAGLSERMARVVELRVFGELAHQEIADVLGVSLRTVAEDWSMGRRWLAREIAKRS